MAVIKNHFETTLSDDIAINTYNITGLTAEDSSTSLNFFCQEGTLYFLKSIYKTLVDAGYTDAVMNEEEYSITVLGFKFFAVVRGDSNTISNLRLYPYLYVYGNGSAFNYISTSIGQQTRYSLSNILSYEKTLSYNIIVRGDENCIQIAYSSFAYPNSEVPFIFIAKAKNLITSKDAFCYNNGFYDNSSNYIVYFRDKEDLYTSTKDVVNSGTSYFSTYYSYTGLNTQSKLVCEPILGNYGTYLTYSMLKCNSVNFERGKYYKIGNDLYFCNGHKFVNATAYEGSYLLFKVS